jgi:hypothetical protein
MLELREKDLGRLICVRRDVENVDVLATGEPKVLVRVALYRGDEG